MSDGRTTGPRRRRWLIIGAAAGLVLVAVAAYLFQPWLLFVDRRVDEALPAAVSAPATPSPSGTSASPSRPEGPSKPPAEESVPRVLSRGTLITHEHPTRGRVLVIEQPDGSRILRIEDLSTTSGPDLRIWLSSGPVIEGREGWFVFADHEYVELGRLKANQGNQNYRIPASADLTELTSVSIWCKRFAVSFGAAELRSA